ncbi:hypothetical protein TcCL_Unassigned01254 [Trypanosoma cruzi]|nr:hypothetical protein TcCL_Unassigned01254 [Trypanosoma cruzi]
MPLPPWARRPRQCGRERIPPPRHRRCFRHSPSPKIRRWQRFRDDAARASSDTCWWRPPCGAVAGVASAPDHPEAAAAARIIRVGLAPGMRSARVIDEVAPDKPPGPPSREDDAAAWRPSVLPPFGETRVWGCGAPSSPPSLPIRSVVRVPLCGARGCGGFLVSHARPAPSTQRQ